MRQTLLVRHVILLLLRVLSRQVGRGFLPPALRSFSLLLIAQNGRFITSFLAIFISSSPPAETARLYGSFPSHLQFSGKVYTKGLLGRKVVEKRK